MITALAYLFAAIAEIAGCFAFWAWLRLDHSPLWAVPGIISLALFALALTYVNASFAGRAFAAYGGLYIAASLIWLWAIEEQTPNKWDLAGASISLLGAVVILYGARA